MDQLTFNLAALAALLPCAILPFRRGTGPTEEVRDLVFWALLAAAIAGSVAWTWGLFASGWQTGIAASLWITITIAYILFAVISALSASFARLLALFGPYAVVLGLVATVWAQAPARAGITKASGVWLDLHITVSVATYALVTLAAMAALGVYLQERALKARKPSRLTAMLPSVADGEALQHRLLIASAIVLGIGLTTGGIIEMIGDGSIFQLNHKIFLSVLSFVVIVGLLIVHRVIGLAGRRAARYLLLAYLLLTLGYPGVKFVTDVILA
ncbi:MAG: cytochrome c biogenesis protein CcsA [Alphaproteobacteria bacterium]|nr:cytochrome c biogenesis protein CcsA [Alphaproteobacteria bacterium]